MNHLISFFLQGGPCNFLEKMEEREKKKKKTHIEYFLVPVGGQSSSTNVQVREKKYMKESVCNVAATA